MLEEAGDGAQPGRVAARAVGRDLVVHAVDARAEEGYDSDKSFLLALVGSLGEDLGRADAGADHVAGLAGNRAGDVRGKVVQPRDAASPAPSWGPCATRCLPRVLDEDDESLVAKIEILDRAADEPLDLSVGVTAEVTDGEPPGLHRRTCSGLSIVGIA